jgi:glutamate-1-semialdehyde 2,1-aminomutase
MEGVIFGPDAYCYRCPLGLDYPDCEVACADYIEYMIKHESNVAAVIVEPVAANMSLVPPKRNYLQGLRDVTKKFGAVLIFDEVITGFRASIGGAQKLYGVKPDLTCLAKIIGGGLPVGAYGGPTEIMDLIAPLGPVYQAGTLSGNPLAMTAGIATLKEIRKRGFYEKLEGVSAELESGLRTAAQDAEVDVQLTRVGSMLGLFFNKEAIIDYQTVKSSNSSAYKMLFDSMLRQGIYLPPSGFETIFVSSAHTSADIVKTVHAASQALKQIAKSRTVERIEQPIHQSV